MSAWAKATPRSGARVSHRRTLMRRQHGRCGWCGCGIGNDSATIDHIRSLLFGGADELRNMVLACAACNGERAEVTTWFGQYRRLRQICHAVRNGQIHNSRKRRAMVRRCRRRLWERAARIRQIIRKYEPMEREILGIWCRWEKRGCA